MSEYEKYYGEVNIKTTGKNLFHTIEIGGIKYTDNIPDGMNIGITKEQYIEYLQLQQENKQLKEELQQFLSDFEKEEAEVFNELEQAINELDLSDKTKNYLIELMNKDVIIVFGIVEDKIQELKEKYK